jgi:hypothetical protein
MEAETNSPAGGRPDHRGDRDRSFRERTESRRRAGFTVNSKRAIVIAADPDPGSGGSTVVPESFAGGTVRGRSGWSVTTGKSGTRYPYATR